MSQDPNWPRHPTGAKKTVGEMTAEERRAVFGDAAARIKRELEHPATQAAINDFLSGKAH